MQYNAYVVGAAALAVLGAVSDVKTRRIPNSLTYSGMVVAIAWRFATLGWAGLGGALLGGLVGGGIFLLLFLAKGMGAGDVKLMAAIGCFVGPGGALQIILACAIAGGLMAVGVMIYHRRVRTTVSNVGKILRFHFTRGPQVHPTINLSNPSAIRLPYGVAIAVGSVYWLCISVYRG